MRHLVNSCSVCPPDDMDKLMISYNVQKNVYKYIVQNFGLSLVWPSLVQLRKASNVFNVKTRLTKVCPNGTNLYNFFQVYDKPAENNWKISQSYSSWKGIIIDGSLSNQKIVDSNPTLTFFKISPWGKSKYNTLSVCSSSSTVGRYSSHWTNGLCRVEEGYIATKFYKLW